jgi:environmental stress-induced protein Ves
VSTQVVELQGTAPTPWKNGGGTTRDLLAWPPDAATWQLRISVAEVARDGPFSDFSGIDRWFAVLHGAGVALQLAGTRHEVRLGTPPLHFDGALAPMCWLLDGATSDLNLLVRRDAGAGSMTDAVPGVAWVSPSAWRARVVAEAAELLVDGAAAARTQGTALIWSAHAAHQRWQMRPRHGSPARGWWFEYRAHDEAKR